MPKWQKLDFARLFAHLYGYLLPLILLEKCQSTVALVNVRNCLREIYVIVSVKIAFWNLSYFALGKGSKLERNSRKVREMELENGPKAHAGRPLGFYQISTTKKKTKISTKLFEISTTQHYIDQILTEKVP